MKLPKFIYILQIVDIVLSQKRKENTFFISTLSNYSFNNELQQLNKYFDPRRETNSFHKMKSRFENLIFVPSISNFEEVVLKLFANVNPSCIIVLDNFMDIYFSNTQSPLILRKYLPTAVGVIKQTATAL